MPAQPEKSHHGALRRFSGGITRTVTSSWVEARFLIGRRISSSVSGQRDQKANVRPDKSV